MQFEELYGRLVEAARQRVRSGSVTERKLARMCGLSQPHMHNVLKSLRSLSPEAADRLLAALNLTVSGLLYSSAGGDDGRIRTIPVMRHRIGPSTDASLTAFRGFMPFAESRIEKFVEPVVAQVAPDMVIPREICGDDFVLLDQNPDLRMRPGGDAYWIVREGSGLRIRYVRMGGTRLYVANENTVREPGKWQQFPIHGTNILEIVLARVVWIIREIGSPPRSSGADSRLA